MVRTRRRLAPVAGLWLVCQLSASTLAPVGISVAVAGAEAAAECTCQHGDGQNCPMHRVPTHSANKSACSWRSTTGGADAVMLSFLGPLAVPSRTASAVPVLATSALVAAVFTIPSDLVPVPNAPPPARSSVAWRVQRTRPTGTGQVFSDPAPMVRAA